MPGWSRARYRRGPAGEHVPVTTPLDGPNSAPRSGRAFVSFCAVAIAVLGIAFTVLAFRAEPLPPLPPGERPAEAKDPSAAGYGVLAGTGGAIAIGTGLAAIAVRRARRRQLPSDDRADAVLSADQTADSSSVRSK